MKKRFLTVLLASLMACIAVSLFGCGKTVEFKVDFMVDGSVYASVSTSGDEVIKMPNDPEKSGYVFDGWYWDEGTWQKPFTADSLLNEPLSSNMSVYAKWKGDKLTFKTLTVNDDNTVYGKVSNSQTTFSFLNEIEIVGKATFVVSTDIYGINQIPTKTVPLEIGDNTFYVTETIGNNIKLYTVTVRRRPFYTVTFNTNNGTSVGNQTIEEDSFATEPTTTRTGYTFTGWDYDFTKPITKNTTIIAGWSANTDTKYKVEYYQQNIENDDYTLYEAFELKGTTDTTAFAEQKFYEHFTLDFDKSNFEGNIAVDGTLVLKLYYTRDKYTIKTDINNAKAGTVTKIDGTYKYGTEFTLNATINAGYTFNGWYQGETLAIVKTEYKFLAEKDITLTAQCEANIDTKYKVEYYQQNLENDDYTLYETVNLQGTTDTMAIAEQKTYEHFTFNSRQSVLKGNIVGDGNLVLKVYYKRDRYKVKTNINNAKAGTVTKIDGTYKYGTEFTLNATINAGYTFNGWYQGETLAIVKTEYKFIVEKDITLTAQCEANTDTEYKVEYYQQNLEDDDYSLYEAFELKGTTDTTAVAEQKTYEHFTFNVNSSVLNGNIAGDGSLVLKVYYTRDKYALSNENTEYGEITNATSIKYGTLVRTEATEYLGCEFLGWYNGEELLSTDKNYTFNIDKNVTAKFKAKDENSNFIFSYGKTICKITGIKDKTVTQVIIPDYVTGIGYSVFRDCSSLKNITIPDSVEDIGISAFYGCSGLASITVPESITNIGAWAFYGCSKLTSVTIPENVTCMQNDAFRNCSELISVEWNAKNLTKTSGSIFEDCTKLTTVIIGDNVETIPKYAFWGCSGLVSVTIPNSVTSIESSAFRNCIELTSIVIPDSVTSIGSSAFYDCDKLTNIHISSIESWCKISGIDNLMGYGSNDKKLYINEEEITELIIPDSVTSIGDFAFSGCTGLTSVTIPDSVASIGDFAFYGCSGLTSITIPFIGVSREANNGYDQVFGCIFGYTAVPLISVSNAICQYNKDDIYFHYYIPSNLRSVIIGNEVTKIPDNAFYNCSGLTSITISNSVTSIEKEAFKNCNNLTDVKIGNGVMRVSSSSFVGCDQLKYNEYDNAYYLGNSDNPYHVLIKAKSKDITSCTINEKTKVIAGEAFYGCNIRLISISKNIISIGAGALYGCDSISFQDTIGWEVRYIRDGSSKKPFNISDTWTYLTRSLDYELTKTAGN